MTELFSYQTSLGTVTITAVGPELTGLYFGGADPPGAGEVKETTIIKKTARQLDEYLQGRRHKFFLPLAPQGTPFQQAVWKALLDIPYGRTRNYKQIAEAVGRPRGYRAVGLANNRNPIAIIIPCHRVIGTGGKLVGYGGGLELKARLLELEQPSARLF